MLKSQLLIKLQSVFLNRIFFLNSFVHFSVFLSITNICNVFAITAEIRLNLKGQQNIKSIFNT